MKVLPQPHGATLVLAASGPLTTEELADLRGAIEAAWAAHGGRVVIDARGIPFLDSAGIELLLEHCGIDKAPRRARLAGLTDTCREALELTDVLPRLEVFDTVENALRSGQS